jgi:hypothetical protein
MLHLALAQCVFNNTLRLAEERGLTLTMANVTADGGFNVEAHGFDRHRLRDRTTGRRQRDRPDRFGSSRVSGLLRCSDPGPRRSCFAGLGAGSANPTAGHMKHARVER